MNRKPYVWFCVFMFVTSLACYSSSTPAPLPAPPNTDAPSGAGPGGSSSGATAIPAGATEPRGPAAQVAGLLSQEPEFETRLSGYRQIAAQISNSIQDVQMIQPALDAVLSLKGIEIPLVGNAYDVLIFTLEAAQPGAGEALETIIAVVARLSDLRSQLDGLDRLQAVEEASQAFRSQPGERQLQDLLAAVESALPSSQALLSELDGAGRDLQSLVDAIDLARAGLQLASGLDVYPELAQAADGLQSSLDESAGPAESLLRQVAGAHAQMQADVTLMGEIYRLGTGNPPPDIPPAPPPPGDDDSAGSPNMNPKDLAALVSVPSGAFWRGVDESMLGDLLEQCTRCTSENYTDAMPLRQVTLDSFRIYQAEVTNAQYARCVAAGDCLPPRQDGSRTRAAYYSSDAYASYPVVYVTWQDARSYCAWAGGRLPTEAEWEKAARGTDGRLFPWGDNESGAANANVNRAVGDTTPVGSYPQGASPYGALDMAGNAYEWVQDWYSAGYYSQAPASNPPGPSSGDERVIRGGSADYREGFAAVVFRDSYRPSESTDQIGFRCVLP